jgi:uncharacterized phiE125 gp8 family phage protein
MALKLVTPPVNTPITLAEIKIHCRVDHADEDALLTNYIAAATSYFDGHKGILGQCMVNQTWRLSYDAWPSDALRISLGPFQSVTTVTYVDANGDVQIWDSINYTLDNESLDAWIIPKISWPETMATANAAQVTFVAGYGADGSAVPAAIRQAMMLLIGHWYAVRETVNIGNIASELPFTVEALLAPFRRNLL